MEKQEMLKNGMDLIYLARCALAGETPDPYMVEAMDLEAVYAMAKDHSMVAVAAYAVESYAQAYPENCLEKTQLCDGWIRQKMRIIRRNLLLDIERESILAHLEQIGCWYMPLKGVHMQELYPKAGMRQMCDNDILIDPAFRSEIKDYMEKRGYQTILFDRFNHDEYRMDPHYNFEMHVTLMPRGARWHGYYQNVKKRLLKDETNQFGYHFSQEDFYLFLMAHAAKHHEHAGNGIRWFMDLFVFESQKGKTLNREYIQQELEKMDLTGYAKSITDLSEKLFGQGGELNDEDRQLLLYHISAGTYGNQTIKMDNGLKRFANKDGKITLWSKVRYSLRRLFPDVTFYEHYAPLAYRYKILIPFAAVYRIFSRLILSFPNVWREAKRTWKKTK